MFPFRNEEHETRNVATFHIPGFYGPVGLPAEAAAVGGGGRGDAVEEVEEAVEPLHSGEGEVDGEEEQEEEGGGGSDGDEVGALGRRHFGQAFSICVARRRRRKEGIKPGCCTMIFARRKPMDGVIGWNKQRKNCEYRWAGRWALSDKNISFLENHFSSNNFHWSTMGPPELKPFKWGRCTNILFLAKTILIVLDPYNIDR